MDYVEGCCKVQALLGSLNHIKHESSTCDRGEEERGDGAPPGGGARRERGEVEEVEEGEPRDAGADEERHEEAERQVVEALQAHDLRHDQPRVPHHRPVEHLRSPSPDPLSRREGGREVASSPPVPRLLLAGGKDEGMRLLRSPSPDSSRRREGGRDAASSLPVSGPAHRREGGR